MLHVKFSPFSEVVSKSRALRMIQESHICESDCVQVTYKGQEVYVYEHERIAFPANEEVLNELKYNNQ